MRLGRLALLATAFISLLTGSAGAAVTSGSNLSQAPTSGTCPTFVVPVTCTVGVASLPASSQAAGGTKAAIDGVIVSWSVRSGGSSTELPVRLRVLRGDTGVGIGPEEKLPAAAGVYSFAARLPVKAGDELGIDSEVVGFGSLPIIRSGIGTAGAAMDYWDPSLSDGETRAPTANDAPEVEVLLNATIEPDADGDGFGDETQDRCASDGTTQGACPPAPPAPATAPETILGKRPAGTIHSRRVSFRFNASVAGSRFQCKLDRKPFKACRPPKTYKGLVEGRHTFKVRAIGPTGLVDPTPGKRKFKVEL